MVKPTTSPKIDWPHAGDIWYYVPRNVVTMIEYVNWPKHRVIYRFGNGEQSSAINQFKNKRVWMKVRDHKGVPTGFQPPSVGR